MFGKRAPSLTDIQFDIDPWEIRYRKRRNRLMLMRIFAMLLVVGAVGIGGYFLWQLWAESRTAAPGVEPLPVVESVVKPVPAATAAGAAASAPAPTAPAESVSVPPSAQVAEEIGEGSLPPQTEEQAPVAPDVRISTPPPPDKAVPPAAVKDVPRIEKPTPPAEVVDELQIEKPAPPAEKVKTQIEKPAPPAKAEKNAFKAPPPAAVTPPPPAKPPRQPEKPPAATTPTAKREKNTASALPEKPEAASPVSGDQPLSTEERGLIQALEVENYIQQAFFFYRNGQFKEALAVLDKIIQTYPGSPDAERARQIIRQIQTGTQGVDSQ